MRGSGLAAALLMLSVPRALAQEDRRGSQDHPAFPTRMPGYYISAYTQTAFASHTFHAGGKPLAVDGRHTKINYRVKTGAKKPGGLAIRRNYENAVKQAGGEVFAGKGKETITLRLKRGPAAVWAELQASDAPTAAVYFLTIVEEAAMEQTVTAKALLTEIEAKGSVAVDILFETAKADIKPESARLIDEIAAMLKANPGLRLGVHGHTDNVGTPAANQALSEQRAKAVVAALVTAGIGADRLTAAGFGQDRPVGDNTTEQGRARNRRVELVKR